MEEKITSRSLMNQLLAHHYSDIRDAKARGEMIGWSTSNFPKEIVETFGLKVMYPENHSAAIASKKGAMKYCEQAESIGYSMDLCSYSRINLGYANLNEEFGAGLDVPKPDFLVVSNNICNTVLKWYENLARDYGIPYVLFDTPYNTDPYVREHKLQYMLDQLEPIIKQIEAFSGIPFDYDKFEEVLEISDENGRLWQEALDLIGKIPSPVNGFEGYNYMALLVCSKGTKETREVLRLYVQELKEKIATGMSTFKAEEKHRILFDGIACWPFLKHNSDTLASHGVNTAGSVYCDIFAQQFKDIAEFCYAYATTNDNQCIVMAKDRRKRMIAQYGCQGILAHVTRSCKPWVGLIYEIERQLEADLGIPSAIFDGDQSDPRAFSKAQYETRVQGLVEVMAENKRGKQ